MGCWIVVRLLLCALAVGVVLCDNQDADLVARIIASSNRLFSNQNEIELVKFSSSPITFTHGRLGALDTLELTNINRFESQSNQNDNTYEFNLNVQLSTMNIAYHFEVPLSQLSGNVSLEVGKNLFQLEGKFTLADNGGCSSSLKYGHVVALNGFLAKIGHIDVLDPVKRVDLELMMNSVFEREFYNFLNIQILGELITKTFKEKFNDIICTEIQRTAQL